ncbi:MAG: hypothetical protein J6M60_05540 [Clostridia bacterium]|nr:hypothetical protein [Clostridia bacterium]
MENASDALLMAFGVLVFVIALTVAITSFSQAREVSELVIYNSDSTNFYEYEEVSVGASRSRIVGIETIIPTLYRYSKENYTVLFRVGDGYNPETGNFDGGTKVMEIFDSPQKYNGIERKWRGKGNAKELYWEKLQTKYKRFVTDTYFDTKTPGLETLHRIFSFDSEEEQLRNEPWTITPEETRKNLDCFIRGEVYESPSDGNVYIDYSKNR